MGSYALLLKFGPETLNCSQIAAARLRPCRDVFSPSWLGSDPFLSPCWVASAADTRTVKSSQMPPVFSYPQSRDSPIQELPEKHQIPKSKYKDSNLDGFGAHPDRGQASAEPRRSIHCHARRRLCASPRAQLWAGCAGRLRKPGPGRGDH